MIGAVINEEASTIRVKSLRPGESPTTTTSFA
jgi:hypothetical protein